jgi:hypothetical protein
VAVGSCQIVAQNGFAEGDMSARRVDANQIGFFRF